MDHGAWACPMPAVADEVRGLVKQVRRHRAFSVPTLAERSAGDKENADGSPFVSAVYRGQMMTILIDHPAWGGS
jgi:hypothetical protein